MSVGRRLFLESERQDRMELTHKIEEHVFESKSSRSDGSSSSSGYGYPLEEDIQVQLEKPKVPAFVPKLNFLGKVDMKGDQQERY
jgi:hypothetical protein